MALIKCPECGREISDKSKQCIHCGYPLDEIKLTNQNCLYNAVLTDCGTSPVKTIKVIRELTGLTLPDAKKIADSLPQTIRINKSKEECEKIQEYFLQIGATVEIVHNNESMNIDSNKVICNILGKDYDVTFLDELLKQGKYRQIFSDSPQIKDDHLSKNTEKIFEYLWNYIDEYDKIPTEITQESIDSMKPIKLFDLVNRWSDWEKNPKFKIAYKTGQVICPKCASSSITTGQKGFSIITGFIGSGQTMNRCANCGYKWKPKG